MPHTSLSQILNITCSVVLDFWKENAAMLSDPSHTSIETSKPTACGLLEQTKKRGKMQGEKKNVYKLIKNSTMYRVIPPQLVCAPLY